MTARIRLVLGLIVFAFLVPPTVDATLITSGSLRDLTIGSDAIVMGRVSSTRSVIHGNDIVTRATLEVEHYLNPSAQPKYGLRLTIEIPGGRVGDRMVVANGMPSFANNERVLVFLAEHGRSFRVLGGVYGKFVLDGDDPGLSQANVAVPELIATVLEIQARYRDLPNRALQSTLPQLPEERFLSLQDFVALAASPRVCPCYTPTGWRRQGLTVDFKFDATVPPRLQRRIIEAAATWNAAGSAFSFNLTPNPASINVITLGAVGPGNHALTSNALNPVDGTLMQTTTTFSNGPGHWLLYDIQGVATHEFGHWFHLDDLPEGNCRDSVMTATIRGLGYSMRVLSRADKDGVSFIYGPNPPTLLPDLSVPSVNLFEPPVFDFTVQNLGCGPSFLAGGPPSSMTHEALNVQVSTGAEMVAVAIPPDSFPLPPSTVVGACPGPKCSVRTYGPFVGNTFCDDTFYRVTSDIEGEVLEADETNNTTDSAIFSCPIPTVLAGPITNPMNGHIYYLLSSSSWINSEAAAVALGGHLATINDENEQTWVYDTFSNWGDSPRSLWIGLNDAAVEGTFVWVSGETPVPFYLNWAPGEPNGQVDEDYGEVFAPSDPRAGLWNDQANSQACIPACHGVVEVDASQIVRQQTDASTTDNAPRGNPVQLFGTGISGTFSSLEVKYYANCGGCYYWAVIWEYLDASYDRYTGTGWQSINAKPAYFAGLRTDIWTALDYGGPIVFDTSKYYSVMLYQLNGFPVGSASEAYAQGCYIQESGWAGQFEVCNPSNVVDMYFVLKTSP